MITEPTRTIHEGGTLMLLAGGARDEDLPSTGFLECLTTLPFGYTYLKEADLFFFSGPNPDLGLTRAIETLGWMCKLERGGDEGEALARLRTAVQHGPVLIGPLNMGYLTYNPTHPYLLGAEQFLEQSMVELLTLRTSFSLLTLHQSPPSVPFAPKVRSSLLLSIAAFASDRENYIVTLLAICKLIAEMSKGDHDEPSLRPNHFQPGCFPVLGQRRLQRGTGFRRAYVGSVVLTDYTVGLVLLVMLALIGKEPVPALADLLWGGLAGVAGMIGVLSFYAALARGKMGSAAPISAVLTAALPVLFNAFTAGLPTPLQLGGFALAGLAIALIS